MGRKDNESRTDTPFFPIGNTLRALRQRGGISLTAWTKKLEKLENRNPRTKGYLSSIENGFKKPSLELISSYVDAFAIPPEGFQGNRQDWVLEEASKILTLNTPQDSYILPASKEQQTESKPQTSNLDLIADFFHGVREIAEAAQAPDDQNQPVTLYLTPNKETYAANPDTIETTRKFLRGVTGIQVIYEPGESIPKTIQDLYITFIEHAIDSGIQVGMQWTLKESVRREKRVVLTGFLDIGADGVSKVVQLDQIKDVLSTSLADMIILTLQTK